MRKAGILLAMCLIASSVGCEVGPRSGRGLRLPDGDLESGALAFTQLGCPECHALRGEPAALGSERPNVIVKLGGEVSQIETHGQLITSIINPSHEISRRHRYSRKPDGQPSATKMKDINERMTVAQLIDLTTFLQSKYKIRLPMTTPMR